MLSDKAGYVSRIAGASRGQLTVITYEILLEYLDIAAMAESLAYSDAIERARMAINTLMSALDMSSELAKSLLPLYVYIDKLLSEAYFSSKPELLAEAKNLCAELYTAFCQAEAKDTPQNNREPIIQKSQEIYAGITYNNSGLQEHIVQNNTRIFKG